MIFFTPFIAAIVLLLMWLARRGSTLTRECRWRPDRTEGPQNWKCLACGARCDVAKGEPRQCLRGQIIRQQ